MALDQKVAIEATQRLEKRQRKEGEKKGKGNEKREERKGGELGDFRSRKRIMRAHARS